MRSKSLRSWSLSSSVLLVTAVLSVVPVAAQTAANEEDTTVGGVRGAHLRIARPTDQLVTVAAFYRDGLGFEVLGSFEDHDGFDGIMLGHPGAGYHLELTHQQGHPVGQAPNREHLLVFYLPDEASWRAAIERLRAHGHEPVPPNNPYWERRGKTFEDPDGYQVILHNGSW